MKKIMPLLVLLSLSLSIVSCKHQNISNVYEVPSFKEIYPDLYTVAIKWRDDAVLDDINFSLYTETDKYIYIQTGFRSSKNLHMWLNVQYLDGVITTKEIYNPYVIDIHPIDIMSLQYDSRDILALFLANPHYKINKFDPSRYDGILFLEYNQVIEPDQLVWRLSISDWNLTEENYYFINPYTGEYLDQYQRSLSE